MRFSAWLFSAKLAWGKAWMRWMSLIALALPILVGGTFLFQVLPGAQSRGNIVYHYNIYLGIDDVRAWWWAIVLPLVWLVLTLADIAVAYGVYRTDSHFSAALVSFAVAWGLPWAGALFYLSLFNV
jgi:hypothetical protein